MLLTGRKREGGWRKATDTQLMERLDGEKRAPCSFRACSEQPQRTGGGTPARPSRSIASHRIRRLALTPRSPSIALTPASQGFGLGKLFFVSDAILPSYILVASSAPGKISFRTIDSFRFPQPFLYDDGINSRRCRVRSDLLMRLLSKLQKP